MHLTYLGGWSIDGQGVDGVKTGRQEASGWSGAASEAHPWGRQAGPGAAASVTQLQSARLARGLLLSRGRLRTRCRCCVFFKEEETCRCKADLGTERAPGEGEGAVEAGLLAMI